MPAKMRGMLSDLTAKSIKGHTMAPYYDTFDICEAHLAIENSWHVGGMLQERESNRRRNESTAVQLARMGFKPGAAWNGYESLTDNGRAIYRDLLTRYNLTEG